MSLTPIAEITLIKGLDTKEKQQTIENIRSIQGVFSANASPNNDRTVISNVDSSQKILKDISKVNGVQKARYFPNLC